MIFGLDRIRRVPPLDGPGNVGKRKPDSGRKDSEKKSGGRERGKEKGEKEERRGFQVVVGYDNKGRELIQIHWLTKEEAEKKGFNWDQGARDRTKFF